VSPKRLLFFSRLNKADFYSMLSVSDVFLDTRPYNSHTVATDALRGGLPLITMMGSEFSGRVAASVNQAARLEDYLTAHGRKSFYEIGDKWFDVTTSAYQSRLMKAKLLSTVGKSLFNSTLFSSVIERATSAMTEVSYIHPNQKALRQTSSRHIFFTSL
jgi:protein O-GlcNAc transferase